MLVWVKILKLIFYDHFGIEMDAIQAGFIVTYSFLFILPSDSKRN